MTMHVVVAGWLLGAASGANRRLLALLAHAGQQRVGGERITVLHRADFVPPSLGGIDWQPIAIPAAPTWRRVFAERRLLARRLRDLGATVYDHGFLPLPRLDVPTCLLVHDLRAVDGLTRWPRWLARSALRRSCAHATAIVTPSRWTAARIRSLAPDTPAPTIVPNGVELPANTTPPAPSGMPANGYLLHVGHLEPRKNLAVVVRALGLLPGARRPELWLAGRDAGALSSLRSLARRLGCEAWLRVFGVVADEELHALHSHCRSVVVPSVHEGFGLCAMEALAHGNQLLVSNCTALPEIVGPHGTLLPPHDAPAWARAIEHRVRPGRTAEAGRLAWLAGFDWSVSARLQMELWRASSPR